MTLSGNKNSLWLGQRGFNVHSFVKAQPKKRYRQPELSRPFGQALCFSTKFNKPLPCFVGSVSGVRSDCKRLLNWPSLPKSPCKITGVKPKLGSPCADVLNLSRKLDIYVRGDVCLLLSGCCPATVLRKVTKTSVNPVYGRSGWSLTHVSKKIYKRFSPPIANRNANRSVCHVFRVGRLITTGKHVPICAVSRALPAMRRVSVFWLSCFGYARRAAVFGKAALNPVSLGKKMLSAMNARRLLSFFCHEGFLVAYKELILAYKATVAGRMIELPGLTKRRAKEMELCLEGA